MEDSQIVIDGQPFSFTVSVAGTNLADDERAVDQLVADAINTLKECIAAGGNTVIIE